MNQLTTSGDLLADRRYRLAQDYTSDGDLDAAADLLAQTIELVPNWAPAWLALGLIHEQRHDLSAAADVLRRAEALDQDGLLGASLHLSRLSGSATVEGMPPAFVRGLFDTYADRFDTHLTEALHYRGPAIIAEALRRSGWTKADAALDLGCGTGLMAKALKGAVGAIDGVDLSPRMIEKARATGLYRALAAADIVSHLADTAARAYDLVLAADVLVYLGDLDPVLRGVARALQIDGVFAFTTQRSSEPDGYRLGADMRFAHGRSYVEAAVAAAGLTVASIEDASTREDRGLPVPGLVVVARRA